uniref:helix-turn-helix domain-containing protein n=1 Tax=Haemophilus influenzae TaxID=727 RepID=UPI0035BE7008
MAKDNTLFKQQVIEFYIQNGKNHSFIRKHFQIDSKTLLHWINQFNHSGLHGFAGWVRREIV